MNNKVEKIALIVGAGAVENAWAPVIKVLSEECNFEITADGANAFFARLVYLMRFYSTGTSPNAKKYSEDLISYVNSIKLRISDALKEAEIRKHIKARKEFKDILNTFIFSETNTSVLISTNWDTVIDNEINTLGKSNYPIPHSNIQTHHIHGTINFPNALYLPSEIVKEPYRSDKDNMSMGNLHGSIWKTIEECSKTILYGLSLDPLDAELSQTLAAGWSSTNLKEIIIINPNHKKIAQRVKLLMDSRYKAKIYGYSPDDFNSKIEY